MKLDFVPATTWSRYNRFGFFVVSLIGFDNRHLYWMMSIYHPSQRHCCLTSMWNISRTMARKRMTTYVEHEFVCDFLLYNESHDFMIFNSHFDAGILYDRISADVRRILGRHRIGFNRSSGENRSGDHHWFHQTVSESDNGWCSTMRRPRSPHTLHIECSSSEFVLLHCSGLAPITVITSVYIHFMLYIRSFAFTMRWTKSTWSWWLNLCLDYSNWTEASLVINGAKLIRDFHSAPSPCWV